MIKDKNYRKIFRYLGNEKYRRVWESGDYKNYSKTHSKRIKNFWDTFEFYGFDNGLLSS
jgi:hypothetical protein